MTATTRSNDADIAARTALGRSRGEIEGLGCRPTRSEGAKIVSLPREGLHAPSDMVREAMRAAPTPRAAPPMNALRVDSLPDILKDLIDIANQGLRAADRAKGHWRRRQQILIFAPRRLPF